MVFNDVFKGSIGILGFLTLLLCQVLGLFLLLFLYLVDGSQFFLTLFILGVLWALWTDIRFFMRAKPPEEQTEGVVRRSKWGKVLYYVLSAIFLLFLIFLISIFSGVWNKFFGI